MDEILDSRRILMQRALAGGLALGLASRGLAQSDWPKGPIKLVVPYAPGGVTDLLMRLLARHVGDRLAQPVVIDNRAGAGGVVGINAVAKAPPDGYTIGAAASSAIIATPIVNSQVPFDVVNDLAFVSLCATVPMVLVVSASTPVSSAPELLKYIRANRGKLSYGSTAVGHYGHVAAMEMSDSQDAAMVHSPYKGETPLLQDLISGQIQVAFFAPGTIKPLADAGKATLLGVSGTKRLKLFPNVPTLAEQGFEAPVFRMNPGWLGIVAPARTPSPVLQRLSTEFAAVTRIPEVNEKIVALGLDPIGSTAESFAGIYQSERPVWRTLLAKAGLEVK